VVLRAVLSNPLTDRGVLEEIVRTQARIGREIWREFEPAFRRMAGGSP
jgi:glutamate decarboxylase